VGGGTQNRLLNQLTADATGRLVLTGPVEATALGNVVMQALALGRIGSLQEGRELIRRSFFRWRGANLAPRHNNNGMKPISGCQA